MHETTRKRICRGAFFVFCLAPTVATITWAAYENRSDRIGVGELRLQQHLHLDAELGDLRTPRPGEFESTAVRLTALGCAGPSLDLHDVRLREALLGNAVTADRATLAGADFPRLAEAAALWLSSPTRPAAELKIRSATIEPPPEVAGAVPVRLSDFHLKFRAPTEDDTTSRLKVEALAGVQQGVVRLAVAYDPSGQIHAKLETAAAPLPGWLIAGGTPLGSLAEQARWIGSIEWRWSSASTGGRLAGTILDLELAGLLPADSTHTVQGPARLEIKDLLFADNRIVRVEGVLTSPGGEVSGSLLSAATGYLTCPPVEAAAREGANFDALYAKFVLDQRGLSITGAPVGHDGLPPGGVLGNRQSVLLMQPQAVELPAVLLAQFAAGLADVRLGWLPANDDVVRLFELLPRR